MSEIKAKNPTWNIWKDGCPGGESVEDITKRIDDTIAKVNTLIPQDDTVDHHSWNSDKN
jgi:hypothetical protein